MEALETAGLSTGFIIIVGIAYRVLKQSNFQFSSSCRERLVSQASEEIRERVREAVENEIRSRATSPVNAGASTFITHVWKHGNGTTYSSITPNPHSLALFY